MNDIRFFCLRGFMKSGTNWVGSLLSSHPEISCVGEFHWEKIIRVFEETWSIEPIYLDPETGLREQAQLHLETLIRRTLVDAAEAGARVVGDRTPHTIDPLPIPNTPQICVVRDGRDVLVSRAFHLYNYPAVAGLFQRIPAMAETLSKFKEDRWYFRDHPEKLLCHEELVRLSAKWWAEHLAKDRETIESQSDLPVLTVRYEDLHADVAKQRRRMFEFLEVDPDKGAEIDSELSPGFEEERPDEFFRKGMVGDWENYFTDQTKTWFNEEAGPTLIELGYTDSLDW